MPKNSRENIDRDEIKVIFELRKNAKESIDAIAKKCGFSRQKVWRILKRLDNSKTVWGYGAVIDSERLEQKNYLMLIKKTYKPTGELIDNIVNGEAQKLADKLGIEVINFYLVNGCFDWYLYFGARDIRHAKKFIEVINEHFKGYVQEIHLLENIFPVKEFGFSNPNLKELSDFF